MTSAESIALIRRAKTGDREAFNLICKHYYSRWVAEFHGELGAGLREAQDTEDIVQSALGDALRDIGKLESEAAFYSWVSAIARRKIAGKRRKMRGRRTVPLEAAGEPGMTDPRIASDPVTEEEYARVLDAILGLFPAYPEPMAAVYLKYFERHDIPALMAAFGTSERSTHRLVETAMRLLRSRLRPSP